MKRKQENAVLDFVAVAVMFVSIYLALWLFT